MTSGRDRRDGGDKGIGDRAPGAVPDVGRRPLTVPQPYRNAPAGPGKRSATQGLRFDVAAAFGPSADECRQYLDKLAVALDTRDFTMAVTSAASLRRSLEMLHTSLEASGGGIDGPAQLNELEKRAKPLLDQAPVVSDDAYRERFYGRFGAPRPQWDAAEASWTGNKRSAH